MTQCAFAFGPELIVDLFAGGGGASLGIEQAFGRAVDIAVNHSADAIAMHAANHPQTTHLQCDVFESIRSRPPAVGRLAAAVGVAGLQALQQGQGRQAAVEEDPLARLGWW